MQVTRSGESSSTSRLSGMAAARRLVPIAALCACTELEVFPSRVQIPQAASPVTFEAYARLRHTRKDDIANDHISWNAPAGVGVYLVPGQSGRNALITITPASLGEISIELRGKGKKDQLVLEVVQASGGDAATAPASLVPSAVALFGNASPCPPDSTYAFLNRASLGDRRANCVTDRLVSFSAKRRPVKFDAEWSDGDDAIDAVTPYPGLWQIPVKAWNLSLSPGNVSQAKAWMVTLLSTAGGIFETNRVGLGFNWDGQIHDLPFSAIKCGDIHGYINADGIGDPEPDRWADDAINLYWVGFNATDSRAKHCFDPMRMIYPPWPKNVIRVELASDIIATSVVHELGHALGLYVPWGSSNEHMGHVDALKGFGKDNVMYGAVDLNTTAARTRLSLGQVYRMHFDPRSWLVTTGPNVCGCDPYGSLCGRLSRDTRLIRQDDGTLDNASQQCSPP